MGYRRGRGEDVGSGTRVEGVGRQGGGLVGDGQSCVSMQPTVLRNLGRGTRAEREGGWGMESEPFSHLYPQQQALPLALFIHSDPHYHPHCRSHLPPQHRALPLALSPHPLPHYPTHLPPQHQALPLARIQPLGAACSGLRDAWHDSGHTHSMSQDAPRSASILQELLRTCLFISRLPAAPTSCSCRPVPAYLPRIPPSYPSPPLDPNTRPSHLAVLRNLERISAPLGPACLQGTAARQGIVKHQVRGGEGLSALGEITCDGQQRVRTILSYISPIWRGGGG